MQDSHRARIHRPPPGHAQSEQRQMIPATPARQRTDAMRTAAFQAAARAACLNALDSEAAPFLANALRPRWARSQSLTAAILAAARAACSNARDSDSTRFPANA